MVLKADESLVIVADAGGGVEAVQLAFEHRPDVILMDLQMPDLDGVEATKMIHQRAPECAILMLTTFHLDAHVLDAVTAGAVGYLLKDIAPVELCRAILVAAGGESVFSAAVTRQLVARRGSVKDRAADDRARWSLELLTDRERAVAEAVAEGASNATIAAALFMSESTVKTHVSRTLAKLGLDNRVQLALMVFRAQRR